MKTLLSLLILILLTAGTAFSDRGMIPHDPDARLFEPNQRAMIAWDGAVEILVLTTDVRADKTTRVLEVLPLPAEPGVTKGNLETFRRATDVINRHQMRPQKRNGDSKEGGLRDQAPAGRITFHKQIGSHDVTVVQVLSPGKFLQWVEGALKKEGVKNPQIPAWAKTTVQQYIDEGFVYFVFDSLEVGPDLTSVEPLRYRFKTDRLFFPLRITKVEGSTTVDLIILTPKLLRDFPALPSSRVQLPHEPFAISGKDLKFIDKEMADLLKNAPGMRLRIWKIEDQGKGFSKDLIAY